ncbi:MAG: hypothetical protein M1829_005996 [Trizodia sp. TS-e1964]|nr:MAG: hypothetical protein M1829_005996 [Trizodia sp. TS-e1964]
MENEVKAQVVSPQTATKKSPVVCVFCGSSPGVSPAHLQAARELAQQFHNHGITLVYGGGVRGIMGEVARALVVLSGPSSVHGIIPAPLAQYERISSDNTGVNDDEYGRTTVVPDMHTRKQMMCKEVMEGGEGSGFVALSGGYGTMEELMEITTWNMLGIHGKGVVVFNVEHYYDGLIQWIRTAVSAGFVAPGNARIIVEGLTAEEIVKCLWEYKVSEVRYGVEWRKQ